MGTRADFYVGRGEQAEWIGSIAWDGYPEGLPDFLKVQHSESNWREAVESFFSGRQDVSRPSDGWPWPWDNSHTTDYSYAFDDGCVWATNWGYRWWKASEDEPEGEHDDTKQSVFPDMKAKQRVTLGKRSGVIVIGS